VLGGFLASTFFRAFFAPRLSFAFATRLRGVALPTGRITFLFRACPESFRALRRAIDFAFRFRTAGRFFR
jgi:hypothetical protein